jgi:hypothetical protein
MLLDETRKEKIKFKSSRTLYKTPNATKDRNNKVVGGKKDLVHSNHSKISQ